MPNKVQNIRLQQQVITSIRRVLEAEGFTEVFPPVIVRASGACESVETMFYVAKDRDLSWFRPRNPHRAHLVQTAQFDLEAVIPELRRVFSIGPTFRAEEGDPKRHLIEFTMAEIELVGTFATLLQSIEKIMRMIISDIVRLSPATQTSMELTPQDIDRLRSVRPQFPRVTYDEAIQRLGLEFGKDISAVDEQRLITMYDQQPVLLTHHPDALWKHRRDIEIIKFFNMVPDPEHPSRLLSVDLLLPFGGEALGGAQRVERFDEFKERLLRSEMFRRLQRKGGGLDDFEWYLKIFRNMKQMPVHSGGGFGIGRILQFIRGDGDIRNVVPFPSNRQRIS